MSDREGKLCPARMTRAAAGLALLWMLGSGCEESASRLNMRQVALPEGGQVTGVVAPRQSSSPLAMGRGHIFSLEGSTWSSFETTWPLPSFIASEGDGQLTVPEQLIWHEGLLWLTTSDVTRKVVNLWISQDQGKTWIEAPQPAPTRQIGPVRRGDFTLTRELRLSQDEGKLYLMSTSALWRLVRSDAGAGAGPELWSWEPIELSGSPIGEYSQQQGLPFLPRRYLAATPTREYELLSVLGEQLLLYRRAKGQQVWVLTYTLPTIDVALMSDGDSALMLTPLGVYTSLEAGELWTTQPSAPLFEGEDAATSLAIIPATSQRQSVWVLGTHEGKLYRSEDHGEQWTKVYESEAPRSILGLDWVESRQELWARTRGRGLLRSVDGGLSWEEFNAGLRLSQPMAMAISRTGSLLLGTDAGLFERQTGADGAQQWRRIHKDETSVVATDHKRSRIWSGSRAGRLWLEASPEAAKQLPFEVPSSAAQLFDPSRIGPSELPQPALVALIPEDTGDSLHIYTRQRGLVIVSLDERGMPVASTEPSAKLAEVLEQSVVTSYVVLDATHQAMTTSSSQPQIPSQLWWTQDRGQTWAALRDLEDSSSNQLSRLYASADKGQAALLVEGTHLWRLDAKMKTLGEVRGPWQESSSVIEAMWINPKGQDAVMVRAQGQHELYFMEPGQDQVRSRILVSWPQGQLREDVLELLIQDKHIYARTQTSLYEGELERLERQPEQLLGLISAALLVGLAALGFGLMRILDIKRPQV